MKERCIYGWLLRLFPPDFRTEHGAEMERLFLAEMADAHGVRRWRVWARAAGDAFRHGLGSRWDTWRRVRRTLADGEGLSPSTRSLHLDSRSVVMDTLRYDLRHALRAMSRQPGVTAIILVTLALAIGATTAVFSTVHAVLITPLPYHEPERLVSVYEKRALEGVYTNPVSPADYLDWRRVQSSFASMAAFNETAIDLNGSGDPERLPAARVSASFFDVFGVRAAHGRTFAPGDDRPGQQRVTVLSHGLWQRHFGGRVETIGRSIALGGVSHEVVGVLPADVQFPEGEAQIFVPLVLEDGQSEPSRGAHYLWVYARLAPATTIERAQAEMDRIGGALEAQHPQFNTNHGVHVTPLGGEVVKAVTRLLLVLMAAVGLILLIACINVTNLLLARAVGRRREMALRSAIGAGRGRLVRQLLVETAVLGILGGFGGLALAVWGVQLLATQMPPIVRPESGAVFSLPALFFTTALCVFAGLLAGALPAWHMAREDPADPLKEGGRSPVSLRRGLRFGLIIAEVALTALLLVAAGLTLRSFQHALMEPAGIETSGRLTLTVSLPRSRYADNAAINRFFSELETRLASEPIIRHVGATNALPLTRMDGRSGVQIDGREPTAEDGPTRAHPRSVTSRYFAAAGMQLREGRGFTTTDADGAPLVAIVNETMARRYWPNRSPLGGGVRLTNETSWREVVGVVADVKHWAWWPMSSIGDWTLPSTPSSTCRASNTRPAPWR